MGRRSDRYERRQALREVEQTDARESLERRWFKHTVEQAGLARLVTGADLHNEPFHRWVPYTQGFSPGLVRLFLESAPGIDYTAPAGVLDPFTGSGTVAIECARRDVAHRGVEAVAALAFLARCTGTRRFPPLPDLRNAATWQDAAARLTEDAHRAALMLAVSRRFDFSGRPRSDAAALPHEFNHVVRMMLTDLRSPMPRAVQVDEGDARSLALPDESAGGILTSPPYLSRHNYTRITAPLRRVYRFWYGQAGGLPDDDRQVRAHGEAKAGAPGSREAHPAETEACQALAIRNLGSLVQVIQAYFDDLATCLREFARVLRPGCPCWMILGGARIRDVYVPSDLVAAEMARERGFQVQELWIARRLINAGRKLGGLQDVAPRETVLVMRRL